jgi:BirA family biotin operon repressor/biotin-[acetyl-CoA-carboxylase] ligase
LGAYNKWLIQLDTIDSTNNYAMQLVQDGMAQNAMVVTALYQSAGKGQRGKQWVGAKGENIAMSLILENLEAVDIYFLSFLIPVCVRQVLSEYMPECQVCIKWPNDIYVNDKKIAGILVETVFRGNSMKSAVVGIGINVAQTVFEQMDKMPTSMLLEAGKQVDTLELIAAVRAMVLHTLSNALSELRIVYNKYLWQYQQSVLFRSVENHQVFEGVILGVNSDFELILQVDNAVQYYRFGTIQWL